MDIVKINIEELNSAEYNPRKDLQPNDPEYVKLKNSIEHFGYVDPIIVNKNGNIVVGGHQRLKVLRDLGYTEIDVVYVELNKTDEKALNIALNKISGEWDAEKLEDLIREISLESDFDVELTGFTLDEINTMFSGNLEEAEEAIDRKVDKIDDLCKEPKEILCNKRNIKLGDKFKLGNHVLLCGDSYKADTFAKLLDGNTCNMIFSDPPYEYTSFNSSDTDRMYKGLTGEKGGFNGELRKSALKVAKEKGFCNFDIKNIEYLMNKNIKSIYFCCNRHDLIKYINMAIKYHYTYDIHILYKSACIPIHTSSYLNDVEYIIFMRLSGAVFNNKLSGEYYRHLQKEPTDDEILEKQFYSKVCFSRSGEGKNDSEIELNHPTIKPLRLIIPRIAISSNENDIVVDMFCGSGSTLMACEKLNRRCYTVEFDPEYCNEAIDRWESYTGLKAEYLGNMEEDSLCLKK